jgi:hypothetical protein
MELMPLQRRLRTARPEVQGNPHSTVTDLAKFRG